MKNLSLKQKILLSVVIALSLVILLLSWQSYTSQKSMLLQGSQEQVQRLGSQQAASVSDWLAARRDVIQALTIPSYERGVARLLRYDRHP